MQAGSETEGGYISLRLDSVSGEEVGRCRITGTDGWQTWKKFTCDITGAAGIHDLYMVFEGDDGFLMNIDKFSFTTSSKIGDLNSDGTVDTKDAVMMQKHLLTIKLLAKEQGPLADINGDGAVTAVDLTLLKQMILA